MFACVIVKEDSGGEEEVWLDFVTMWNIFSTKI